MDPSILVSVQDPGSFEYGILFARTLPLVREGRLQVVIQVCAPLIAYGLKGTVHAILAHEFLHYLELIHRASGAITSDETSGNIRDSVYADGTRVLEPGAVFSDRTLVSHITKRFPAGFRDARLEAKTITNWIDAGLPRTGVDLGGNTAVLPAGGLAGLRLETGLAERLKIMAEKSSRMRGRMARAASGI
ncbi:hypothetical protein CENSYa_0424 [Cenarchaeum symbiosum A]|uniref:Uncharacterized protein n=1 Tax=Cenarchaeum symbiosum (strain A) TaxID=414004 RepID=A0RUP2_CENSY|nr:hypothetical protein CENSYa_0424 [Cenarchaeum symbiosum A]